MSVTFYNELTYARICVALIYRDCSVLWRRITAMFLDSVAPLITQVSLYGYFFPLLGMTSDLIAPLYMGSVVFFMMFLGYSYGLRLIFDIKYTRFFEYFLLLPMPKRWLMTRYAISFVIESFIVTTPLLVIGLYILRNKFAYANPNFFLFGICYLLLLLFFGMLFIGFGLYYEYQWFSHNVFPRRITPFFCISPVFLIWKRLHAQFPILAQLMFINPCTYFAEGLRASFIGGDDFLPLSLCIPGMIFFILLTGALIHIGLKKSGSCMMYTNKSSITRSFFLFLQFLYRDFYVHLRYMASSLFNYAVIYPATYAFAFAYLQTNVLFGAGNEQLGTMLFTGNIIVIMMVISYKHTVDLLFDLEHDRYIDYQLTLLSPRLLILERIIFAGLYTCVFSLPFFPVAKLCLGSYLATMHTSWASVILITFVGSMCCAAYHQMAILMLKRSNQISTLWARINHMLINFGGFWIPLYIFREYSPILEYAVYANPFLYITEGLRRAILARDEFLPVWLCIGMLITFSIICTILSWYLFKKRVDHI